MWTLLSGALWFKSQRIIASNKQVLHKEHLERIGLQSPQHLACKEHSTTLPDTQNSQNVLFHFQHYLIWGTKALRSVSHTLHHQAMSVAAAKLRLQTGITLSRWQRFCCTTDLRLHIENKNDFSDTTLFPCAQKWWNSFQELAIENYCKLDCSEI